MSKKRKYDFKSRILLLMILLLALALMSYVKDLRKTDLSIRKTQLSQQIRADELEARVKGLEKIVISQNKMIKEMYAGRPVPEISRKDQRLEKPVKIDEPVPSLWPSVAVGAWQVLKTIVDPVKSLLPN